MKERKTDIAKRLFLSSDFKGAFGIYKTFRMGFSREEKRVIEIAHEVLAGKASFYQQLGIDTASMVLRSKEVIINKICKS